MPNRGSERSRLKTFFQFDDIIDRPFWVLPLGLLQVAIVVGGGYHVAREQRDGRPDILGYNILEGVLAGAALLIATALIVYAIQVLYKLFARMARNARLRKLERHATEILKSDYKRALKAILRASELQPEDLRPVDRSQISRFESQLFVKGELETFLGPLRNQTLRAVTPHGPNASFAPEGENRLTGENYCNGYFMPFRVSCVFFTKDALVIGEAICEPATGELQKRVRKVPRASIRSSKFNSSVREIPISKSFLENWFENRRLDREERKRIRKILDTHDRIRLKSQRYGQTLPDLPFQFRQYLSYLDIELTSGQSINLPMRHDQVIIRTRTQHHPEFDSGTGFSSERLDEFDDLPIWGSRGFGDEGDQWWGNDRPGYVSNELKALWSSGRQATHREFSAFWPFVRSVVFGLLVGVGAVTLMNAVTVDWTEQFGSSEEFGVTVETPQGEEPLIPEDSRLADPLKEMLAENENLRFACTRVGRVTVNAEPAVRSGRIAMLDDKRPLLADQSEATPPPSGWQRVLVMGEDEVLSGFVRSSEVTIFPPRSRTVCS